MTVDLNVTISLHHVKSADNPADAPSRRLSVVDSALAPRIWSTVQRVNVKKILAVINATYAVAKRKQPGKPDFFFFFQAFFSQLHKLR